LQQAQEAVHLGCVSLGDSYMSTRSLISASVKPRRLPRSVSFRRVRSRAGRRDAAAHAFALGVQHALVFVEADRARRDREFAASSVMV
jgi:hypothetical protein